MTVYELKNKMYEAGEHHFFDAETLKFFGERMSEMKVLKDTVTVTDISGQKRECLILSVVRHKNWNGHCKPYRHYHYIDAKEFTHVILPS